MDGPANALKKIPLKQVVAWAFYDWANTGYAMIGLALILPQLYESYFAEGLTPAQTSTWFGVTIALGSVSVAVLAPFLGSIAELSGARKRMLLGLASVGMLACASLYLIGEGQYLLASAVHVLGMTCFYSSNIFFDSMLDIVSTRERRNLVSGIGFSFGYVAGLLLIVITAVVNNDPGLLGQESRLDANRALFVLAAVWWAVFSIPLALAVKDTRPAARQKLKHKLAQGARATWQTQKQILKNRPVWLFLVAYLFYIDGLNTVITQAAFIARTMGFAEGQVIIAFACVQISAIPFSILFGLLAQRFGARTMLLIGMGIYFGVTLYGAQLSTAPLFAIGDFQFYEMYVLALLIGSVQGGIQALSRAYFANIIPPDKTVAFFGFYSMIGKSAAILGPAIFALCALLFNDPDRPVFSTRVGFAAIGILFVLGGIFLWRVGAERKESNQA